MKEVYIVGEDDVTRAIVKRVLKDYTQNLKIIGELPARGGEIKQKLANFNQVAQTHPVILLLDLDANNCAPQLKDTLLNKISQTPDFVFNIAVDEAEAWLFADKDNFASFLKIDPSYIPTSTRLKMNGPRDVIEIDSPIKSSLLLTHTLALKSSDKTIREQLGVPNPNDKCKGKEYNSVIVPFIRDTWDVEIARKCSDSLDRMITRLEKLDDTK